MRKLFFPKVRKLPYSYNDAPMYEMYWTPESVEQFVSNAGLRFDSIGNKIIDIRKVRNNNFTPSFHGLILSPDIKGYLPDLSERDFVRYLRDEPKIPCFLDVFSKERIATYSMKVLK